MLAWARENSLKIVKDAEGNYDWHVVYQEWMKREEDPEKARD